VHKRDEISKIRIKAILQSSIEIDLKERRIQRIVSRIIAVAEGYNAIKNKSAVSREKVLRD